MPRLHICLVSDQTIPNFLPALMDERKPDKAVLLLTREMKGKGRSKGLVAAFKDRGINSEFRETSGYDVDRIREDIKAICAEHDGWEIACNITCGTKIMTVGAYEACLEGNGVTSFYVDTQDDKLIDLLPAPREAPLPSLLKVKPYLQLYGFEIESCDREPVSAELREVTRWIVENIGRFENTLPRLHSLAFKATPATSFSASLAQEQKYSRKVLDEILPRLAEKNLLAVRGDTVVFLDKAGRDYAMGGWFEDYVYSEAFGLRGKDTDVMANVNVRNASGTPNEIDLAITHRNRLFLVECKARLFQKGAGAPDGGTDSNVAYKLGTLRDIIAGTYGKGMLVSYRRLPPHLQQRCNDLRIRTIAHKALLNLREQLADWLAS